MKTHAGSLQRKGKRYYLVIRTAGRQRWLALKTDKLPLARLRAARIAPHDPDDEKEWLEQFVREGERARCALIRRRAQRELTWESLADRCRASVDVGATSENRACHAHWLDLLSSVLKKTPAGESPGRLCREDAERAVCRLSERYLSAPRMLAYFRRVWRDIGLDAEIWPKRAVLPEQQAGSGAEHYRRLSADEVRRVFACAGNRSQDLADMVLLGYSTGLRLSDVAELELSEVELPFLRVCPNKTRRHKPRPLKIPLAGAALETVVRLKNVAEAKGLRYLFAEASRRRPSRKLTAVFRSCGVVKEGGCRASFHSLRATFISLMDDAGIPPHLTDSITGHGGGGMHARYTQPSDKALLAAVERAIPPLCRPGRDGCNPTSIAHECQRPILTGAVEDGVGPGGGLGTMGTSFLL